mgnify:FL=1
MDEQAQNLIELNGKMERMMDGIESVKEKQNEMAEGIDKIKEAVYNPDEGIYARLRELENWKETSSKLIWMIVTSVIGLSATLIARVMLAGGP